MLAANMFNKVLKRTLNCFLDLQPDAIRELWEPWLQNTRVPSVSSLVLVGRVQQKIRGPLAVNRNLPP